MPPADFPQFSYLPPDLRQKIWAEASSIPSSIPGICILTMGPPVIMPIPIASTSSSTTRRRRPPRPPRPQPTHAPLTVHEPLNTALLTTNTEAHDICLRSPGAVRPYDPTIDILYLDSRTTFEYFISAICERAPEPWVASVRHLAVVLSMSNRGLWLPNALMRLESLETLSIVYPGVGGTFDCHAIVPSPVAGGARKKGGRRRVRLREMTGEERKGTTVEADYMYETHGGDAHIVWRRDVDEHLEMVEENLVMWCQLDSREWRYPIWDGEAGRLRLRYRAMVWEEVGLKPFGGADEGEGEEQELEEGGEGKQANEKEEEEEDADGGRLWGFDASVLRFGSEW